MGSKVSKVPECPDCKDNRQVVKIIYGYAAPGAKFISANQNFVHGGCVIKSAQFHCKNCKKEF